MVWFFGHKLYKRERSLWCDGHIHTNRTNDNVGEWKWPLAFLLRWYPQPWAGALTFSGDQKPSWSLLKLCTLGFHPRSSELDWLEEWGVCPGINILIFFIGDSDCTRIWKTFFKSGDQTSISGLWSMITNELFAKRKWRELNFFRCLFWCVPHCTRHSKYIFLFESCYSATKLVLLSSFLRGEIVGSEMAQNISKWWGRD